MSILIRRKMTSVLFLIWGRNGFDGGFEVRGASSGGNRFNKPNF